MKKFTNKAAEIKNKLKGNAPVIVSSALSAAVATAYVFYLKNLSEKYDRFPIGERTVLKLREEDLRIMTEEDAYPVYNINGHAFQVQYDPVA